MSLRRSWSTHKLTTFAVLTSTSKHSHVCLRLTWPCCLARRQKRNRFISQKSLCEGLHLVAKFIRRLTGSGGRFRAGGLRWRNTTTAESVSESVAPDYHVPAFQRRRDQNHNATASGICRRDSGGLFMKRCYQIDPGSGFHISNYETIAFCIVNRFWAIFLHKTNSSPNPSSFFILHVLVTDRRRHLTLTSFSDCTVPKKQKSICT